MMIRYRGGSQLDTGCSANICGDVDASTLLLLLLLLLFFLSRFFLAFSHFLRRDCETCRSVHGQNMASGMCRSFDDALIVRSIQSAEEARE